MREQYTTNKLCPRWLSYCVFTAFELTHGKELWACDSVHVPLSIADI
jgi:hypothetical protein